MPSAVLNSIALLAALFIQSTHSIFAGAWLWFLLLGCGIALYRHDKSTPRSFLWWITFLWLVAIGSASFIIRPVYNGAYFMWTWAAMPILALSLTCKDIKLHLIGFGAVLMLYALGLGGQKILDSNINPFGDPGRMSWPLIDPNNSAAMINMLFIPLVYLTMYRGKCWVFLMGVAAYALYATGSRTGIGAAAISAALLAGVRYGRLVPLSATCAGLLAFPAVLWFHFDWYARALQAFMTRLPIWWVGWQLLWREPWRGIGLGYFARGSVMQHGTVYLPPTYAHNDLLQLAVETGFPVAAVFCLLLLAVAGFTRKTNYISGGVWLAIFIQSLMEFQFYLPPVTIGMGLVLAYHINYARMPKASRR